MATDKENAMTATEALAMIEANTNYYRELTEKIQRERTLALIQAVVAREPVTLCGVKYVPAERA